ncbi:MAG: TIR domain-containing protein, partial [Bacilli bacterium]|nr:TIR domain-containing protein [Bacilli bacterium]
MKIELISCPRCGESDLVFQDGFYRCRFCGAMLKEDEKSDIEERIAKAMEAGRESDLGKLRFLLNQSLAVQYPDPAEIRDRCDDILRIIPEDISASFFRAFFKRKKNRAEYQVWFKSFHEKLSPFHKKLLYPYIIDLCDYVDADCVKTFLKQQGDSLLIKKVDAALKEREAEIERFSNVPRDVFVCHAHADIKKILPLVERIEKEEGFSFWLSERNMPIDVENYKVNIENAIKNCRIFLVFASQASMQSSDVHWELDVAEELGKDKRIEYRLEDRPNNIKFKHFFDGIQWIDGARRPQSDELAERIYLLKKKQAPKVEEPKPIAKEEKKEEAPKKDPNQAKLKAISLKIKFGKFEEAVSDIFAFLG